MAPITTIRPGQRLADDESLLALAEFLHHGVRPRERSLWLAMLDSERRMLPAVVPFHGLAADPGLPFVARLGYVWAAVLGAITRASTVLVLERPGAEAVRDSDRAWHAALHASAAEVGIGVAGFFLATTDGVRPLTPDDL
ncbi:hypothetical protein [Myceligenerans pegani]|uniref:Uncharacterized protein n=1 Tax=Myceligenerans pegani TaxID=2776917 RepID=A0ABR9N156_9MICO|nr:hypothetical protein [Myceligenerans sp. TRM 65318]MBE1877380.1 hypothetical protein [Myceligenerans sp. TRM 65318]MBE3019651.1 hypothetical protein [Myceligenerans sp. TRM 65318]